MKCFSKSVEYLSNSISTLISTISSNVVYGCDFDKIYEYNEIYNKPNDLNSSNGDIYEGEFKDGLQSGYGKMSYITGDIYEGYYVNDKRNGYGKYTYTRGDIYEGYYVNDERNGLGKYTYSNDDKYEGYYVNDKRNGLGKYTYASGNIYSFEGEFKDDMLNSICKIICDNGDIYEGEFKDNYSNNICKIINNYKPEKL